MEPSCVCARIPVWSELACCSDFIQSRCYYLSLSVCIVYLRIKKIKKNKMIILAGIEIRSQWITGNFNNFNGRRGWVTRRTKLQNKERTEVQSQIHMKLFYSITSCVIGEVPLIDLPFVMIILQAYNRIAHQEEWVFRTLLSKHFVSSLVSRSLS